MKSKLLKVLITTLCVLGILFVIVAVPFILGGIAIPLMGWDMEDGLSVWGVGFIVCLLILFVAVISSVVYNSIDL